MSSPSLIANCWKTIGVQGDGSCPELERHIHCRNCPVYSAAAVTLLDGEPPPDYFARWGRQVALKQEFADPDTHSIVIFRIGAEWLALPAALFQEIAGVRVVHSLPHRRGGAVLGLANIRGELLVCVSLRQVLGIEAAAAEPSGNKPRAASERLLVILSQGHRLACPVDEVHGIERFNPRALKEVPATVARATATYTRAVLGWQNRSVGVLDEQLLFHTFNRSLALATLT